MLNWFWNLVKPKSPVYESTGLVRGSAITVRYWKPLEFRSGPGRGGWSALETNAFVANIVGDMKVPDMAAGEQGLLEYAVALAARAQLSAVEVIWNDDEDRRGIVVYRDWP